MRAAASLNRGTDRIADALARTFALWRNRDYPRRRGAIAAIASSAGYSDAMLEDSIDALLKPFTSEALNSLAVRVAASDRAARPKTVGFIAAGNVAGAGIHEIAIALVAGAGVLVKTASAEPVFFAEFARTLAEIDRDAGSHIEVLHWSRARTGLTAALIANCDLVAAYGDDRVIDSLQHPNVIGFGSRVSAGLIMPGATAPSRIDGLADLLARDVALFEQLGCLSLNHVFVISPDGGAARELAIRVSAALERLGKLMPPARIPIPRRCANPRRARARALARNCGRADRAVRGSRARMDSGFRASAPHDSFKISPGFRTLHVTGVRDFQEFRDCIAGVAGRIETMAVAAADRTRDASVKRCARWGYRMCARPGEMQSPPLDWPHGGGGFIDRMVRPR